MKRFSILIVSYNSANDLDRLFDCLDEQSNQDFETILIDNASPKFPPTEGQIERADKFIANETNSGFACANNFGSQLANGEWLILLNPDAFPKSDWLEQINIAIEKYSDCENFGCLQLLDGHNNMLDGAGDCFSIAGVAWRGGHRKPLVSDFKDGAVFSTCGAASVWKKSRFLSLSGFEESFVSYYEDVDLGFRHLLMGGKSIQLANAIVSHKGSASSGRYSEYAVFHGVRNREIAYIRNMPFGLFWLCLPIHIAAVFALWLHAIYRGAGASYSRAIIAAIKSIPSALRQRRIIQKTKTASTIDILRLMSFSPLSLLKRAIILRKIK